MIETRSAEDTPRQTWLGSTLGSCGLSRLARGLNLGETASVVLATRNQHDPVGFGAATAGFARAVADVHNLRLHPLGGPGGS